MPQVKFVVDAEVGRAIQQFLKVVDAQKKGEEGFKRMAKSSTSMNQLAGFGKSIVDDITGMVSGMFTMSKAYDVVKTNCAELVKVAQDNAQFHRDAAGAASLPAFITNLPEFKARSLKLSERYGMEVGDVSKVRERVALKGPDMT